jgi:signal peptidase II
MGTARLNRILLLAIVTAAVIALDQVTKVAAFALDGSHSLLGGVVVFDHHKNPGAAFGILRNVPGSAIILTITTLATIVLLAVLFRKLIRTHLVTGCVALALIYGGAIGNLIDRVAIGMVRDFIELRLHFFTWPAFNVADIMIVAGIILLLAGLVSMPAYHHAATATDQPPADARRPGTGSAGAEKEA